MIKVNVRSNVKEVIAEIQRLPGQVVEPATIRALNRTLASSRVYAARELKRDYGSLPIAALKAQMRVRQANRTNLRAVMTFSGRRIRLSQYGVSQTAAGLKGRGLPKKLTDQAGRQVAPPRLANAFLNRTRRHRTLQAFVREGKGRYPLQILLAPALAESIVEGSIGNALATRAVAKFQETLEREIKFRMSKL